MEGISNEACSLGGHWGLGKLIALYDDNKISIDGDTDISFTEDVAARFKALGWHVQHVPDGNTDLDGLRKAIQAAKDVTDKPSFIKVATRLTYKHPQLHPKKKRTTVTNCLALAVPAWVPEISALDLGLALL